MIKCNEQWMLVTIPESGRKVENVTPLQYYRQCGQVNRRYVLGNVGRQNRSSGHVPIKIRIIWFFSYSNLWMPTFTLIHLLSQEKIT